MCNWDNSAWVYSDYHFIFALSTQTHSLTHTHLMHKLKFLRVHTLCALSHIINTTAIKLLRGFSLQTVPHQLPCSESREPAFQRGRSARCAEGCLPALVQCLSLPGAERTKVTEGTCVTNKMKGHHFLQCAFSYFWSKKLSTA